VVDEWEDAAGRDIAWCAPTVSIPPDKPGSFGGDDDGGINSQDTFAQWFRDVPGVNMSRLWTINLTKDDQDIWCFDTSNFNPIDEQLLGNGPDEQNFYFTCEIVCTFVYDDSAGQFFRFEGDDDCWVFVDNKLAIDHGGIASGRKQRIDLNRMSLVNGQTYALHFFMAERYQPQTQFHIKTNIDLMSATSGSVFAMFD
jgi:fibro-slime domain-containing protein